MVFGHFKTKHPTSFCVLRMFRWSSCEWSMVNASLGWSHCHGCQVDLLWLTALKLMFSFDRRVTGASHLTSRQCPCPVAFFGENIMLIAENLILLFLTKRKNTNKNLSILSFKLILTWLAFEKFSGWTNCHGELSRIACVHVRCEVRSQSLVKVVAGCCYEKCSDRCSHLVLIAPIVLSLISPAGQRGGCGSPTSPITDDVWRIMVTIANQCPRRPPTPPQPGHNQQPGKVRRREDWNWVSLNRIYLQHAQKGQKWCWFTSVYNFLHSSSIFSHKYWSNLQHFPIPVQCSIVSLLESRSALRLFARDNIIVCCLLFSVSPSISAFHVNI